VEDSPAGWPSKNYAFFLLRSSAPSKPDPGPDSDNRGGTVADAFVGGFGTVPGRLQTKLSGVPLRSRVLSWRFKRSARKIVSQITLAEHVLESAKLAPSHGWMQCRLGSALSLRAWVDASPVSELQPTSRRSSGPVRPRKLVGRRRKNPRNRRRVALALWRVFGSHILVRQSRGVAISTQNSNSMITGTGV
jgi:hypothetical protein